MGYIAMAYIVMTYIIMACVVMAYIVMTCIVMAYIASCNTVVDQMLIDCSVTTTDAGRSVAPNECWHH